MPYLEQQNLYRVANVSYSYYNVKELPDSVIQTQIPTYLLSLTSRRGKLEYKGRRPFWQIGNPPSSRVLSNYRAVASDGTVGDLSIPVNFYQNDANGMLRPSLDCPDYYTSCVHTGKFYGRDPTWTYKDWKLNRPFKVVTDGLSNTFMIGEQHVFEGHAGERATVTTAT